MKLNLHENKWLYGTLLYALSPVQYSLIRTSQIRIPAQIQISVSKNYSTKWRQKLFYLALVTIILTVLITNSVIASNCNVIWSDNTDL